MPEDKKFCSRCGAPLAEGAAFCSSCGAPVTITAPQPPPSPPRREHRGEKEEKREKHEKGEKGEKHEKREKNGEGHLGAVVGGSILVWLGLSFYLSQIYAIHPMRWWALFLSGLGLIIIIQGLIRYSQSGSRHPLTYSLLGGALAFTVGLASLGGMMYIWPLVLVLLGVFIIISATSARRRAPRP